MAQILAFVTCGVNHRVPLLSVNTCKREELVRSDANGEASVHEREHLQIIARPDVKAMR